jgi:Cu-Zn family superoxide dismutase
MAWKAGVAVALGAVLAAGAGLAQEEQAQGLQTATGTYINTEGAEIGTVTLTETPNGVLIVTAIDGLPEGVHAYHIHEAGDCEPPDFTSAGGHYNPTDEGHGYHDDDGYHAGDLPNVHVGYDGVLMVEHFTDRVTLGDGEATLFDQNGSAMVIHQGPDDYQTDPAGASGPRIACAVIEQAPAE